MSVNSLVPSYLPPVHRVGEVVGILGRPQTVDLLRSEPSHPGEQIATAKDNAIRPSDISQIANCILMAEEDCASLQ